VKAVRASDGGVTVVEMKATSVCASDLGYIEWGFRKILGHKLAGLRQDGTPVVVEALYGCMECEQCRRGAYNLCPTGASSRRREPRGWEAQRLGRQPAGVKSRWSRVRPRRMKVGS
jgi:threonine dehydrogenase-like Zn-dependent dehydrogenase